MKLASILSPGLFKSSLKRFWPLWLAGLVGLVLLFDVPMYGAVASIVRDSQGLADRQESAADLWGIMNLFAWCYGLVGSLTVALALHEHLFDARSATFVGSIPVRRPAVFATVALSGLLVLLALPALAVAFLLPLQVVVGPVLTLAAEARWYALVALFVVVFYAVALISCQLAGTRPVAGLLYLVICFLAICIKAATDLIVSSLVYGLNGLGYAFDWASPAAWLLKLATTWMGAEPLVAPAGIAGYVVAAVAMFVLAGWLFCRRDLERAGDSVAVAPLRPALKYLAGVSMALLFGSIYLLTCFGDIYLGVPISQGEACFLLVFMVLGGALGVLFAEMIMRRSAHVLAHCWRAALAVAVAAVAFVGICRFDLTGAGHFVPTPDEVEEVVLQGNYDDSFTLVSPENVAAVCELHQELITHGDGEARSGSTYTMMITYHLKGGRGIQRVYSVASSWPEDGEPDVAPRDEATRLVARFAELADSPEGRASRFADILEGNASELLFHIEYTAADGEYGKGIDLPADENTDLLEAFGRDLMEEEAGALHNEHVWSDGYDASIEVQRSLPTDYGIACLCNMQLSDERCPHTVAWLKEHHPEVELRVLPEEG